MMKIPLRRGVFIVVQCANRPPEIHHHKPHDGQIEPHHDMADRDMPAPYGQPPAFDEHRMEPHEMPPERPPMIGQHDVMATIMLVLMLGMNLGIKFYFRHKDDQHRLVQLERENLEQQLEYLKYQINPHFFMNTLNNIHALVDIEPEMAKESIVELSKILRYVLYEGARQRVPLNREIAFIENYIQLMRIRLTDHVKINIELPELIPECELPPLLLITFIENAFKHGVSYTQPSFIDILIEAADGHLHFNCRNSKVPQGEDKHGGLGLQNARRRLDLIYPGQYTLDIDDGEDTYNVDLTLPL